MKITLKVKYKQYISLHTYVYQERLFTDTTYLMFYAYKNIKSLYIHPLEVAEAFVILINYSPISL